MLLVDEFAHVRFGSGLEDFDPGVVQQQAQQLSASVTGRANNRNFHECSFAILRI